MGLHQRQGTDLLGSLPQNTQGVRSRGEYELRSVRSIPVLLCMDAWDHIIRMWACVSGYVCWYWRIFPSFPNPLALAEIGLSPPVPQSFPCIPSQISHHPQGHSGTHPQILVLPNSTQDFSANFSFGPHLHVKSGAPHHHRERLSQCSPMARPMGETHSVPAASSSDEDWP